MSRPRVPRNPDFEHFRKPPSGLCWWCGAPATTREHKYKRTDLELLGGDNRLYWGGDPARLHLVKSVKKGDAVRFRESLCAPCNNKRSQPFDHAYDIYRHYILSHLDRLWQRRRIDVRDIYGTEWKSQKMNLARYYVKHFGCRLVDEGFAPPRQMADFLDGNPFMANVHLALVAVQDEHELYTRMKKDGRAGHRYSLGGLAAWVANDRSSLDRLITASYIGYLGVRFEWSMVHRVEAASFFSVRFPMLNHFQSADQVAYPPPANGP